MSVVAFPWRGSDGRAARWAECVLIGYISEPATNEYQRGFLAAVLELYREGLGRNDPILNVLERQVRM